MTFISTYHAVIIITGNYTVLELHVSIITHSKYFAISDWLKSPSSIHNQPALNNFSTSDDSILLDLDNSSRQTQPYSIITYINLPQFFHNICHDSKFFISVDIYDNSFLQAKFYRRTESEFCQMPPQNKQTNKQTDRQKSNKLVMSKFCFCFLVLFNVSVFLLFMNYFLKIFLTVRTNRAL